MHGFSPAPAAKLGIGFLLRDIYDLFTVTQPKFSLISGHDTTIFPILAALGVFDGLWPPYAARIVFELYSTVRLKLSSLFHLFFQYFPLCTPVSFHSTDPRIPGERRKCGAHGVQPK
jgi:hypothetical protein